MYAYYSVNITVNLLRLQTKLSQLAIDRCDAAPIMPLDVPGNFSIQAAVHKTLISITKASINAHIKCSTANYCSFR